MVFVLVHSPLVGPSTWSPVARELGGFGEIAAQGSAPCPAKSNAPRAPEAQTSEDDAEPWRRRISRTGLSAAPSLSFSEALES
jgi:hypothetical protein